MQGKKNFLANRLLATVLVCLFVLIFTRENRAGTPGLGIISPRGVQRGAETDLFFRGSHFQDAREIMFVSPGVTVTRFDIVDPTLLRVHVRIDKDAPMGEHCARVRGDTGISEVRTFYVTPFPIIKTRQGAHVDPRTHIVTDFEHPELVKDLNVTLNGFAGDSEITATDTTVSFPVLAAENAPPGRHPTLFCSIEIMKDGEPIIHNVGQGGALRVDKPVAGKAASPVASKGPGR